MSPVTAPGRPFHGNASAYGSDSSWIEEVPNLIKRDMKSLTDKGSGSAPNLNLQQVESCNVLLMKITTLVVCAEGDTVGLGFNR